MEVNIPYIFTCFWMSLITPNWYPPRISQYFSAYFCEPSETAPSPRPPVKIMWRLIEILPLGQRWNSQKNFWRNYPHHCPPSKKLFTTYKGNKGRGRSKRQGSLYISWEIFIGDGQIHITSVYDSMKGFCQPMLPGSSCENAMSQSLVGGSPSTSNTTIFGTQIYNVTWQLQVPLPS